MTISGCGANSNIVTNIKLKPKYIYCANYYTPLTDQAEETETPQPPTDTLVILNHVEFHQHQPRLSHLSGKLVTATHNRLVTQPEDNTKLYYTASEINTFKNVSKAKGKKPLQLHPEWQMTQQLIMMKTQCMQERGIVPKHQVLDNEVSSSYKEDILATGITLQLELLDNHRRNIAEKAIQTWKYHLIGVMSVTSTKFPLHFWCQAIPQAERQLLLLRKSNVNPTISAYAYVYDPHDHNA